MRAQGFGPALLPFLGLVALPNPGVANGQDRQADSWGPGERDRWAQVAGPPEPGRYKNKMRTATKLIAIALSSRVRIFALAMTVQSPVGPMSAAPVAGAAMVGVLWTRFGPSNWVKDHFPAAHSGSTIHEFSTTHPDDAMMAPVHEAAADGTDMTPTSVSHTGAHRHFRSANSWSPPERR